MDRNRFFTSMDNFNRGFDPSLEVLVRELKHKLTKYEEFFKEMMNEADKIIGFIASPAFKNEGIEYYRCKVMEKEMIASFHGAKMFKEAALNIGTEVLISNAVILGVIPENLLPKKEKTDFKLISWDKIRGLKSQLKQIKEAVELPMLNSELMKEFGAQEISGMLLYGPPGCGKTLIAKAIASQILNTDSLEQEAFHYIKGAQLLSQYVGVAEHRIAEIFKQARLYSKKSGKRAVIFIDEAEAILPARGSRWSSDVDKTIVPTFLSEMDGLEGNNPFVLLATNMPEDIDPAILREGRIDVKISVSRPTKEDAIDILKLYLCEVKTIDNVDQIANHTADLIFSTQLIQRISGAMLATIVSLTAKKALSRYITANKKGKKGIITEDVNAVISEIDVN